MLTFGDFNRLAAGINNKLMMLINWVLIKALRFDVNNRTYNNTVAGAPGEDNPYEIEQIHNYGFVSRPLPGAEGISVSPIGDPTQSVMITVQDRRYQIEIAEGEVAIYTHKDIDKAHKILLNKDGNIEITGGEIILKDKAKLGAGTLRKLVNEEIIDWADEHKHKYLVEGVPTNTTKPNTSVPSSAKTVDTEAS
jgi:phage gp45-like